jgi:hypothetical protein
MTVVFFSDTPMSVIYAGNASLFGYAADTSRGMASRDKVAIYKVCWENGDCLGYLHNYIYIYICVCVGVFKRACVRP